MKTGKESACWGEAKLDSGTWCRNRGKGEIFFADAGGDSLTAAT